MNPIRPRQAGKSLAVEAAVRFGVANNQRVAVYTRDKAALRDRMAANVPDAVVVEETAEALVFAESSLKMDGCITLQQAENLARLRLKTRVDSIARCVRYGRRIHEAITKPLLERKKSPPPREGRRT